MLSFAIDLPNQKLIRTYTNGREWLAVAVSGVCVAGGCGMISKSSHCSRN